MGIVMYTQNDKRWSADRMGKSDCSLGGYGCVVTSLCNIANIAGQNWTPKTLNKALSDANGFTADGCIWWNVAEKVLKCKITPHYKGELVFEPRRTFYIGHYYNKLAGGGVIGHFTNLFASGRDYLLFYDVYSGKYLWKEQKEVDRFVKAEF